MYISAYVYSVLFVYRYTVKKYILKWGKNRWSTWGKTIF